LARHNILCYQGISLCRNEEDFFMGKFLMGLLIGLIALPVLGAIFLMTGSAPAAVSDAPFFLEKILAGAALHARISREAPKRELSSFTKDDLVAGAKIYRTGDCVGCHGMPPPNDSPVRILYPPAPQLLTPDGMVNDDPVGESYWKVKNGIRLTGMPSYKDSLTDEQIWQVAALVASADKLTPEAIDALKPQAAPPTPASASQQNKP
jgi:thiosulfate dehydrogenase